MSNNNTTFHLVPFDAGPKPKGECAFTVQSTLHAFLVKKRPFPQTDTPSCTDAYLPHTNAPTQTSASTTLPVASTTTGQALRPFWTKLTNDLSAKLWLPTPTDLFASDWSAWNGFAQSMIQKSWFSSTLKIPLIPLSYRTTFSPSQLTLWHATTAAAQQKTKNDAKKTAKRKTTKKAQANASRKIRLEPSKAQAKLMFDWMGTARWVYNQGVASNLTDKQALRSAFVNNDVYQSDPAAPKWVLETPYEIRDTAVIDLAKAIKSSKALVGAGHAKQFKMSFRSKKDQQQSFVVRNRDYQSTSTHFSLFRGAFKQANVSSDIKARESLPHTIAYDARLIRTRLGEWYLCIPEARDDLAHALGDDNQVPAVPEQQRVCSLDPGVRTFQTIYDPSGAVIEIGAKDLSRLYRLCDAADKLQSRRASVHGDGNKRYRMQRAILRINRKIRRLVSELHCKVTKFLVDNYSVVLLPSFETSRMVVRNKRKLTSKTARAMLTWSHYGFKQRLLNKAALSGGKCKVVIVTEEYTSKTCTNCGYLHSRLGSSNIFRCPACATVLDRDYNGARNILLKHASHFHFGVK